MSDAESDESYPPTLRLSCEGVETEADVELKVITPILTGANSLEIPISWIRAKEYLAPASLDKAAGKLGGYYPDYSVWEKAFPVLIVEAKAPDVKAEVGYREASLYARHLNQVYKTGLNPCQFILATNGRRLLAGNWDSAPIVDIAVEDLVVGDAAVERLRGPLPPTCARITRGGVAGGSPAKESRSAL
jgi:hypothetical protein